MTYDVWEHIERNLTPRAEKINSEIRGYQPEAPKKDRFDNDKTLTLGELACCCMLLRKYGPRIYRKVWEAK